MFFEAQDSWNAWLEKNHASSPGIWMKLFKKKAGTKTIVYKEALDAALCYGWIDAQRKPCDHLAWLQKFVPRGPRSGWSKINTGHVERLTRAGSMAPAGLKAVAAAKADGRWENAYTSPANAVPPADFLQELSKDPKAAAYFKTLNRANIYSIVYRLETAKGRKPGQNE